MQKVIDDACFDWSREARPNIVGRGIAAIAVSKFKAQAEEMLRGPSRCVWPSGFENVNTNRLTRRVGSR